MTSGTELMRKMWRVPEELREPIHNAVLHVTQNPHLTRTPGRIREDSFEVSWTEHGRLHVRWDDGGPGQRIMVEGRSRWSMLTDQLQAMAESEHQEHALRLEVDLLPGRVLELDEDDLGRMEHALEELYGHQISVRLVRT